MKLKIYLILFSVFLLHAFSVKAQFTSCIGSVPTDTVDFSNSPDTSTQIAFDFTNVLGECCNLNVLYNCYEVILNLHPNTTGVTVSLGGLPGVFEVYPTPCGSSPYTVNQFDATVCLNGAGPHRLLFCTNGLSSLLNVSITTTYINTSYTNLNVTCNGGSDGKIKLVTDGPTSLSYLWSNGSIDTMLQNLTAGSYTVTISDANGCSIIGNTNITEPLTISPNETVVPSCSNIAIGSITLNVSGGTPPYTYLWDNNRSGYAIFGLFPGDYNVVITDSSGCTLSYGPISIAALPDPTITVLASADSVCLGEEVTLTASGAVSYDWDNGVRNGLPFTPGVGTLNYTVIGTDANGCTGVSVKEIFAHDISGLSTAVGNATCDGYCDGQIVLTVSPPPSNPSMNYTYNWSNGITVQNIELLCAGPYSVTVTDDNNCSVTISEVVNQPTIINLSFNPLLPLCHNDANGALDLTPTGGTTPYTYLWNYGYTTEDITGIQSNNYIVTVTDANGCTNAGSSFLPDQTPINISATARDLRCNGFTDGAIDIVTTGGFGTTYTYVWSNGETTDNISGLSVGSYTVTVTDQNGCIRDTSKNITQPSAITVTHSNVAPTCTGSNNGVVFINVSGGAPSGVYQYLWNDGRTDFYVVNVSAGSYTVTVTDDSLCTETINFSLIPSNSLSINTNSNDVTCGGLSDGNINITLSQTPGSTINYLWNTGAITEDLTNIPGGFYEVTITDNTFNCFLSFSQTILEPTPIQIIASTGNLACFGGSTGVIDLTTTGGVFPNGSFLWSNGAATEDLFNIPAGTYSVTATDINGCFTDSTFTITEPTLLTAQSNITQINCYGYNNGSIDLTPSGGIQPYSFTWSNNETTEDISGLAPGVYDITISDINNCSISASYTVTEPSHISSTIFGTNPSCYGLSNGIGDNAPGGGTPPYSYLWSNNETTEDISGLSEGTYNLTITDANSCTNSFGITITNPAELIISNVATSNSSCTGANDGTAEVLNSGGTAPYSYNWNNNAANQTGSTATGLNSGSYMVTVTDANNCIDSANFFVNRQTNFSGRVVMDANNNCLIDAGETGIIGTMIRIERTGANAIFTNVYDSVGNFAVSLDSGSYIISLIPPNPYWQSCAGPQTITVDSTCTQVNLDWVFQPIISCPFMTVDLNVPILRKTRPSFYNVTYCNTGDVDAINASVQVKVDPLLNVLSTSIPAVSQTGNVYNFNVGNVGVGQCGTFFIEVIVDLAAFSGQTHCSYAHVFPDSICIPNLWSGAILNTKANCNNDTVVFRIENNGAAMSNKNRYYILENDIIIAQDSIQLGNGSFLDITQPAALGKTYRIIANQEAGYPELLGDSVSTVFVENCNVASGSGISIGYGLTYSNGDIAPVKAVDCTQNRSALDPNDKRGQPEGYGVNNYIYDYTTLEYTIRFQNMGSDTAFNVVLFDTLSQFLDVSSIIMGASSHNHIWQIIDGNVLRISFPDIMLPDTISNEPLSHGFIKYRIDQQAGNPLGTIIENRAGIYFDFEPVVITNTTRHIVNEDFEISMVSTEPILKENVSIQVFPNPFDNQTTIKVSGFDFPTLTLSVFDLSGKLIREIKGSGNQLQLSRDGLNQGLYFYKLSSEGDLIHSGKIIVR